MKKSLFVLGAAALLSAGVLAGCGESGSSAASSVNNDHGKVTVGLQGNLGASAGFVGIEEGYFKEEGVTVTPQVTTGPNIITGLKSGTIDIGFLGNGVSWNYFVADPAIKMLTIDNLSDDDRLIASTTGKGKNLTLESPTADLFDALKGSTVALDYAATPGTFLKSLIDTLNNGKAAAEQLWFKDVDDVYPTTAGQTAAYQITIQNMSNGNVTAAMTGSTGVPDFCVAFAPISTQLINKGLKEVAKTSTHMPNKLTPSTWAVSTSFLDKNADTVQYFMNGLVKAFNLRGTNINRAVADTANQLKADTSDYNSGIAYWPTAQDLYDWFKTDTSKGYTYVDQIRQSQINGTNLKDVTNPKTAKEVVVSSYLINACKTFGVNE